MNQEIPVNDDQRQEYQMTLQLTDDELFVIYNILDSIRNMCSVDDVPMDSIRTVVELINRIFPYAQEAVARKEITVALEEYDTSEDAIN